jgi:hypothetical protein
MSALFQTGSEKADKYVDAALQVAGIGVLAYLLGEYERAEEYEECTEICKAIAAMSDKMEPPKGGFVWGDEMKEWIANAVHEITFTDGSIVIRNMPEYANMVERTVNP